MFRWLGLFRRIAIRRVTIWGVELELKPPVEEPRAAVGSDRDSSPPTRPRAGPAESVAAVDAVPPGARFTVHGRVVRTIGKDIGIRVRNEAELREFWRIQQMGTDLDWFGKGPPVVSIGRKADIRSCKPGDEASLTFVVEVRPGGKRGTRAVAFEARPDERGGMSR